MNELEYKEHRRAIANKCQRRRREIAKESGICICCVKRTARKGMATCWECSAKISAANKRRNAAGKNQEPDCQRCNHYDKDGDRCGYIQCNGIPGECSEKLPCE